ncbi:MAG: Rid family hydrolase [Alkalibacterium sp.]|nr:Rid family hydrolase [Alkalibacterium sp.]
MSDIGNFQEMNDVYSDFFQAPYPARIAYEVAALPAGALVEIDVIAGMRTN